MLPFFSEALPMKGEEAPFNGRFWTWRWAGRVGSGCGSGGEAGKRRGSSGCARGSERQDSHQLRGGAVESGLDHLQAGDVLGTDSGGGPHTHAALVPKFSFGVCWELTGREKGCD